MVYSGMTFSDQLRRAIRASKLTQYRIAEEADIHRALLWRFMRGETGITTTTLDAPARVLRLRGAWSLRAVSGGSPADRCQRFLA